MSALYAGFIKRILGFLISFFALIALSPLFAVLAVAVRVKLGSPVIFKQQRPGRDEKIFTLYKFRTMTDERGADGELLPDSERLVSFGRFLRASSLDELPELINILKGDMSFVGPRPLAVQYLPFYNEQERRRHTVRPGLTGWAQVCGRNAVRWEDRFAHDTEYVDMLSFATDVKVLFLTVKTVLKRSGIGERGVDSPIDFDVYRSNQTQEAEHEHINE